jgi:hypothetical protein
MNIYLFSMRLLSIIFVKHLSGYVILGGGNRMEEKSYVLNEICGMRILFSSVC